MEQREGEGGRGREMEREGGRGKERVGEGEGEGDLKFAQAQFVPTERLLKLNFLRIRRRNTSVSLLLRHRS